MFQPISFMAIQVRVACALIPLIAIYKYPALFGITIGHFIFNLSSPLGVLDYLSPFIFLAPRILINFYGVKAVPIHIASVGLWVGYVLFSLFNLPLLPTISTVLIGEAIAELALGLPLFYAIKRRSVV